MRQKTKLWEKRQVGEINRKNRHEGTGVETAALFECLLFGEPSGPPHLVYDGERVR